MKYKIEDNREVYSSGIDYTYTYNKQWNCVSIKDAETEERIVTLYGIKFNERIVWESNNKHYGEFIVLVEREKFYKITTVHNTVIYARNVVVNNGDDYGFKVNKIEKSYKPEEDNCQLYKNVQVTFA